MTEERLIGREKEIAQLQQCMQSSRSELVIIYGRRRVGKTFLVDHFFNGHFDFSFVGGHNQPQRVQLRNFAKALKQCLGERTMRQFGDWYDAFDALEEYLSSLPTEHKKVVFVDEMPWIDSLKSSFVQAFENFWNGWASRRSDIVFVASGSATSWMVDNLVDNPGGLHARITRQIYLRPFTLYETECYLRDRGCQWDRMQMAQCYMYFGGVPFYLSLLDVNLSLTQNVDQLCFASGGALQVEFNELYQALFTPSDSYIEVARQLASHSHGMTYTELMKATKIEGQRLTKILTNLQRSDFVMKFRYYGNRNRNCLYRLTDFYTLFYYKFIEPHLESYDEMWWSKHALSPSVTAWQGLAFELVCLMHIPQIRQALGLTVVATEVSDWFDRPQNKRGAQIDLIIERADRIIHLCEMKFSNGPFIISADYEHQLRNRMELFREQTRNRKTLVFTFVTTFGVMEGVHSSLVHSQVTLDQLFMP